MGLLETILGSFGMGESAPPVSPEMMDSSGGYPPDPRDMSIQGFPPGGPPLPRPRPPEAGPGAPAFNTSEAGLVSDFAPTDIQRAQRGMDPLAQGGTGGGLAGALGLDRDKVRSVAASLGAGLANVKNSPFIGEAISNAGGKAIEGGNAQDELTNKNKLAALDRALKLKQINDLGSYRDDITDVRRNQVGVNQQNADTGATRANNTFVLGKDRNGIASRRADTAADVGASTITRNNASAGLSDARTSAVPSIIRRNEASAGLSDARTKVATGEIDMTEPVSKRAARADAASDRFYKPRLTQLTQAKMRIQAMPGTPQQKQEASALIDQKMQDLDTQYFQLKEQNRKVHGIGPNGEDLAPRGKAGASAVSPDRPQKSVMGTREDPHEPKTPQDFDAIQPGQVFRDPGDGKLYEK